MYVRKRPVAGKSHVKIQVCESVRKGDTVTQKTLRHVGTAKSEAEVSYFVKTAEVIIHQIKRERQGGALFDDFESLQSQPKKEVKKTQLSMEDLEEVRKETEGPKDIFSYAADEMELPDILPAKSRDLLRNLIAARICAPASKRQTQQYLEKDIGFECSLDSIYRLLSELEGREEQIIEKVSKAATRLYDSQIDLMFFDVTTLYFESWTQDGLRDFGFSKDCKFGQVQVTLALATQKNGFPVGYKLFPGNQAEITTLISSIESWKKSIDIKNVVFVADRGMFSASNLHAITKAGFQFVVGCPLKKLSKETQKKVLSSPNYKFESCGEKEALWHSSFEHSLAGKTRCEDGKPGESFEVYGRLISTYSSKRAKKDASDRQTMIEKTKKKFEKKRSSRKKTTKVKELLGNRGYTKYLKVSGSENTEIEIDTEKIALDSQWDGMSGIFTNAQLGNLEALNRYRGLWQIEECFRISKTNLKIRPVYHYKPERVAGHIALCFMSLAVLKYTQEKVTTPDFKITTGELIKELNSIGSTVVKDKRKRIHFRLPWKLSKTGQQIYKAFRKRRTQSTKRLK